MRKTAARKWLDWYVSEQGSHERFEVLCEKLVWLGLREHASNGWKMTKEFEAFYHAIAQVFVSLMGSDRKRLEERKTTRRGRRVN